MPMFYHQHFPFHNPQGPATGNNRVIRTEGTAGEPGNTTVARGHSHYMQQNYPGQLASAAPSTAISHYREARAVISVPRATPEGQGKAHLSSLP